MLNLSKEQIITKYNLKSNFSHIGQRKETNSGFKDKYSILYPIYNVIVNNEIFEFNSSANSLRNILDSKSCIYLNESNYNIYCDIPKGRDLYNRVNTGLMTQRIEYITDIKIKSKFYELSVDDLLFAFRCILQEALVSFEGDYFDFIDNYGYEANRESKLIFDKCKITKDKLKLRENEILFLLNNLADLGIE